MKIFKRIVSILSCAAILYCGLSSLPKVPPSGVVKLGAIGGFLLFASVIWLLELNRDEPAKKSGKANFDWGMHYFRAFAIVAVMSTHYTYLFGYDSFCEPFLSLSAIYFLFISGYFSQYVEQWRHDAPFVYFRKKLLNVICPFVLFSIAFLYARNELSLDLETVKAILLGRAQCTFWYIPFVSLLFVISPFLCRMKNGPLVAVCCFCALLFLLFPFRPGVQFDWSWPYAFYLYSYFSVFYVVGFVYCRFKRIIDKFIASNWWLFLFGAVMGGVLLLDPDILGLECFSRGMVKGVQQTCVLVCVLVLIGHLRTRRIRLLDWLAQYSFTLYFIHFGLFARTRHFHDVLISHIPLPAIAADCVVFCIYLTGMLFAAMVFKKVLGRHSRMFLGA